MPSPPAQAACGAGALEAVVAREPLDARGPGEGQPARSRAAPVLLGLVALVAAVALGVALVVAGEVGEGAAAPLRSLQAAPAAESPGASRPFISSSGNNPFSDRVFYVTPSFAESLGLSIPTAEGHVQAVLEKMKEVPTAFWLSSKERIRGSGTGHMEGILADAAAKTPPQLVTFIIYNLPNRDCAAMASNGEICCTYLASGRCDYTDATPCAEGLAEYKSQYIDPIANLLREYEGRVPVVVVVEPDSLPNLSTNQADPRCGNSATLAAYRGGITYAVQSIGAAAPRVGIYLDAGNGAWLGWAANMKGFVDTVKDLGVAPYLRGFATNVAGYQGLGKLCPTHDYCLHGAHPEAECCVDPCGLNAQWNPSHNALNYALHLRKAMSEGIGGFEPHMIIDTGRNGLLDVHNHCATWCNVRGAGAGRTATTETADPSLIDAYFWLKTPGESDGCSERLADGSACPRYDTACGSVDSIGSEAGEPLAPEAGSWFDYQIKQLAANARLS